MRNGHAIICNFSDPCDYRINDGVRTWFFDWSDRFGPSLTNGRGTILDKQPSERSRFWRCVSLWRRQGARTEPFGSSDAIKTALFDEPPAGTFVMDPRGVIVSQDLPDGFDDDFSEKRYLDQEGNPWKPRRGRRPKL